MSLSQGHLFICGLKMYSHARAYSIDWLIYVYFYQDKKMNNRVGLGILGILLIAAVIFGVVQMQNVNQSRSQVEALEKTITRQAGDLVNQVTVRCGDLKCGSNFRR